MQIPTWDRARIRRLASTTLGFAIPDHRRFAPFPVALGDPESTAHPSNRHRVPDRARSRLFTRPRGRADRYTHLRHCSLPVLAATGRKGSGPREGSSSARVACSGLSWLKRPRRPGGHWKAGSRSLTRPRPSCHLDSMKGRTMVRSRSWSSASRAPRECPTTPGSRSATSSPGSSNVPFPASGSRSRCWPSRVTP